MPRLTGKQLADLRARVYANDAAAILAALDAAKLPADLVTLAQASAVTNQTLTYLRKRLRRGSIRHWRVGKKIVISLSELVDTPKSETRARLGYNITL